MTDPTPTLEQLLGLDNEGGSTGGEKPDGKGLRAQLEQVLAENRQLKAQQAQFSARERERVAAEMVTKHSIPPLARDLLLKETEGDLTDEAVTAFVAKYGELWGAKAAEASTTPAEQAATQQVQTLSAQGTPPSMTALFDEDAYRSQFMEAKSKEEVMRMIAEATGGIQLLE